MKKYAAELFGTFVLTIAVLTALAGATPVPPAAVAGLTLGLFVYTIGRISGAHLNPAVTVGLWSVGKVEGREAVSYIIAQFAGAAAALLDAHARNLIPVTPLVAVDRLPVLFIELGGAFLLTFGVAAVMYDRVPTVASGAVIGGSLFLGATVARALSNGVINPAVAFGIGSFSFSYLVGPLIGGVLGMQFFRWLVGGPKISPGQMPRADI